MWSYIFAALFALILVFVAVVAFWLLSTTLNSTVVFAPSEQYFINSRNEKCQFPQLNTNANPDVLLSVVVPAYNEEKRLSPMMKETMAHLSARAKDDKSFTWEVVIVSDGSKDKTVDVAHSWTKREKEFCNNLEDPSNIRVMELQKNRGKGGAVKRGFLVARGKYILMVDADGATRFSDINALLAEIQKVEKSGQGVAIGSRAHLQDQVVSKRSMFRNILMWGFHLVVTIIGGIRNIKDTQCGFKLFTRKSGRLLFANVHLERWAFDVEVLWLAQYWNIPIKEMAVHWTEIAGSHLEEEDTILVSLKMLKDLVRVRLSYTFGIWKLQKLD